MTRHILSGTVRSTFRDPDLAGRGFRVPWRAARPESRSYVNSRLHAVGAGTGELSGACTSLDRVPAAFGAPPWIDGKEGR